MPDQRERGREERRTADSLHGARNVERGDAPSEAAEERRSAEDEDADHEHQPASEAVGQSTGREDQGSERQRVRVDDPLESGQASAEATLDARQRHVHDRDVEQEHERRRANGDERPARPPISRQD